MGNNILWRILKKESHFYNYWKTLSSGNYTEYLRSKGVKIGDEVLFRHPKRTTIDTTRPWLVEIGNNVDINDYFTIMTHDFMSHTFQHLYHDFIPSSGRVKIGNNVTFGRNVTVLKGVEIGDNCCIGAGSIVTKDIPPNSLAVGIPCKRICSVDEYYQKRKTECIEEAIDNGVAYFERYGELPPKDIFFGEWTLFMNEQDIMNDPKMKKFAEERIGKYKKKYFDQQKLVYNGYDDFLQEIKKRLNI